MLNVWPLVARAFYNIMFTVVTKFDDILHIHRNETSRGTPRHTVFSFMSDFKYTPYVTVPGFPRLEKGMRVAALLREENDWKTLIGWRDLDTGALAAPDQRFHRNRIFVLPLFLAIFEYFIVTSSTAKGLVIMVLPLLLAGAFGWLEFRNWRRVKLEAGELERLPNEA